MEADGPAKREPCLINTYRTKSLILCAGAEKAVAAQSASVLGARFAAVLLERGDQLEEFSTSREGAN
jgi:hypothetical protein